MKRIKLLLTTLLFAAVISGVFSSVKTEAATGPNTGSETCAYIIVSDDSYIYYVFDGICAEMRDYYMESSGAKADGATYDKSTNTLTLNNCKLARLETNEMGDDFKIKLVGNNSVDYITVWGYGYGGSLTFCGDGTLNGHNIVLRAEYTESSFAVKDKATVNFTSDGSGSDYFPFAITETLLSKDAVLAKYNGTMESEKTIVPVQEPISDEYGFTDYYDKLTKGGKAFYGMGIYSYHADLGMVVIDTYDVYSLSNGELTNVGTYANLDSAIAAGYNPDVKYVLYTYACFNSNGVTFTASDTSKDTAKDASKDTAKAPVKGDVITANGAKYTVTKAATKDTYGNVTFKAPKSGATSVTIPATITIDGYKFKVTAIAASAFSKNKTVTSVTIGKNVKTVGKKAFYYCSNLTELKINSTKFTATSVKASSFKGVSSKCVVTVPAAKKEAYKTILQNKGLSTKATIK